MLISLNTPYNNYFSQSFTAKTMKINVKKSEFAEYIKQGKSCNEIAEIYNASNAWVSKMTKALGLDSTRDIKRKRLDELMPELVQRNATLEEMQEKTGASRTTVLLWIRSNLGQTKTERKREELIELFKMNLTDAEIARKLHTNTDSIRDKRYRYGFGLNGVKSQKHLRREAQMQTLEERGNSILEKVKNGASFEEAAEELGISKDYAYKILRQLKLQGEVHRTLITNKNRKKAAIVLEKMNGSNSVKEAAKDLKVTPDTAYHYIKSINMTDTIHKNNRWNKNKDRAELYMQKLKSGMSFEEIAQEFNVSISTVKRYIQYYNEYNSKI